MRPGRPCRLTGRGSSRARLPDGPEETPFLPGPTFAAAYRLRGEAVGRAYGYGRYGNPMTCPTASSA